MSATVSSSWHATKLKFTGRIVGGGTPESSNPDYWDGAVPWLTPVDLGNERNDAITASKRTLTEAGVKAAGLERLPIGSVVFSTRAPIGSVGLLAREAVTNQGCKALVPDTRELDSRFCFYLALDSADMLQSLGLGTTFVELSTYALKNFPISLPSPTDQHRIAAYLDEQTAKIDRLMEMRRRQMALLKEQRAALIQQAVTRGLNSNAPMKDSGLPWLGEVPVHWEVKRFHHSIAFKEGPGIMAVDFHEEGVPLIRISNLRLNGLDWSERTCLDPNLASTKWAHFRVRPGDLLISSSASMGLVSEVDEASNGAIPYTGIIRLRPASPGLTKQFIKLFVDSGLFATQISMYQTGSTIQHFGPLHLRRMFLAIPPVAEQNEIIEYVQQESARRERLLSAYTRQLEVLTEYRAALIHECVTGQRTVTQRTVVEAASTKTNVHFLRAVLCSEIVHRLHQEPTFGRVKLEKFLYLSEAYAGIDLQGQYQRAAAGPFDNRALRSAESQIEKQKWYQPVKKGKGTRYIPMEKAGGHRKYFSRYWPEQQPKFDRLVDLLRSFDTERCEIIATLFAVWNDRLQADQPCTDADIVDEVLTQWHPSKQRIPRKRWLSALKWMEQEGLIP